MFTQEPPLEPERPIIDPHLHMWNLGDFGPDFGMPARFLLPEITAMIAASGHNITHSVFVECGYAYHSEGPDMLRPVGETETVVAAADEALRGGGARISDRIVGSANLLLGSAVRPVLEAHVAAAGGRFRGIRMETAWSAGGLFGHPCRPDLRHRMADPAFVAGAAVLADMDLSLDIWCLHSQLGEVIALADALPGLAIVLDHIGTPDAAGPADQVREQWLRGIGELARRPNVTIKLGGLGMNIAARLGSGAQQCDSTTLASRWRPWIDPAIEAFGPRRAMFESNFPPDAMSGSYGATWNAFKRIAAAAGDEDKDWLLRRTAAQVYRITLD